MANVIKEDLKIDEKETNKVYANCRNVWLSIGVVGKSK